MSNEWTEREGFVMRRDMELVREILKDITKGTVKMDFKLRGPEAEEDSKYIYHLEIMRQAGLINYTESKYMGGILLPTTPTLTWLGNDFLESIENDTLWEKTKEAAKEKGLELTKMPLDVIVGYAKLKAKEILGLDI